MTSINSSQHVSNSQNRCLGLSNQCLWSKKIAIVLKKKITCYTTQSKCIILLTLVPPSGYVLGSSSTKQFCTKILEHFHFGKKCCLEETIWVAKVPRCGRDWFKSLLPSFRSRFFFPDFPPLIRAGTGLCSSTLQVRFTSAVAQRKPNNIKWK